MTISGLALAGVAGTAALFAVNGRSDSDADIGAAPAVIEEPAGDINTGAGEAAAGSEDVSGSVQNDDAPDTDEAPDADAVAAADETAPQQGVRRLDFTRGSMDDLRDDKLTGLVEKISGVPGVADKTKVWVAKSDVASTPGMETLYHVKGPLTCGSVGCDLVVVDQSGSALLSTVGESVVSPQIDTLIINQGAATEVTWVFNGAVFIEKK